MKTQHGITLDNLGLKLLEKYVNITLRASAAFPSQTASQ